MAQSKGPDLYERIRQGFKGTLRTASSDGDSAEVQEMRKNRAVNSRLARRTAAVAGSAGRSSSDLQFATGRPRDPLFYYKQNNLAYDLSKNSELEKLRTYLRLIYATHPTVGACVDIYTKYPTLGMEVECKDNKITEFYQSQFFDEESGLDYESFLLDFGREYWTVGEAIPFGSFNESLGVWDTEELLNPDDVDVERSPFLRDPRFFIRLPETLRTVLERREPIWEYEQLINEYPELIHYARENAKMPVSSTLLKHYRFKGDTFNHRGVPLLMRALRSVMQEEMLNSAQDAIADRLYTPLILVRLGASASDLGTTQPWIPDSDDLNDFEEALDSALAADFRAIIHHFGVQIESVFGRENMPDMNPDFERLEEKTLQTFGLSRTMLSGASSGQTYAADAINKDLVSQLMGSYQKILRAHFRKRAAVVAEAQEHYDYEERNGKRYVKMEEVLEVDEETGREYIVEQPKLLIPDLKMRTVSLKDEESERQLIEALNAGGIPISMKTRLVNTGIDFDEQIEKKREEQVRLAVEEQKTRKEQFIALRREGLPIPQDLMRDFQPLATNMAIGVGGQGMPTMGEGMRTPAFGMDPTMTYPNLAPTQEDLATDAPDVQTMNGSPEYSQRPEESDEMRADMPKAAQLFRSAKHMREVTQAQRVVHEASQVANGVSESTVDQQISEDLRRIASKHTVAADADEETRAKAIADREAETLRALASQKPVGMFATPGHVGMRRHAGRTKNTEWYTLKDVPEDQR